MKLEEFNLFLQKRYLQEQEKKAVAEKTFKEELKNEILKIIHLAELAIEDNSEEAYKAYEEAREKVEDISDKPVFISFKIGLSYMDCFMNIDSTRIIITRYMLESDVCKQLDSLLAESYRFNNRGEEHKVNFDSYLEFSLTESTIKLAFSAKPSACGGFTDEERQIIKKFSSDIKEILPSSEEIPEAGEVSVDLTVTLKCYGIDISKLGQSLQNSDNSSTMEENDLVNKQKLLAMSIDELDFSVRAYNAMKCNGIYTIGDLMQISLRDLKQFKRAGAKTVNEVLEKLHKIGLELNP